MKSENGTFALEEWVSLFSSIMENLISVISYGSLSEKENTEVLDTVKRATRVIIFCQLKGMR